MLDDFASVENVKKSENPKIRIFWDFEEINKIFFSFFPILRFSSIFLNLDFCFQWIEIFIFS